jgi:hypothetical protein
MAVETIDRAWSAKAAADLSSKQYTLVKLGSGNTINVAAAGDAGFVLVDKPKSGQYGTIALQGICKVQLGGTVNAGDYLSSDANGHAIKATDGSSTIDGTKIIGQALEDGVSGDLVTFHIGKGLA